MTERPEGTCRVCDRKFGLLKDGTLRRHGSREQGLWPPQPCRGWKQFPLDTE